MFLMIQSFFLQEMKVQGLLGITLDEKEVFVVHINELFSQAGAALLDIQAAVDADEDSYSSTEVPIKSSRHSEKHKHSDGHGGSKRSHNNAADSSIDLTCVKLEKEEVMVLDTKLEPCVGDNNEHGPAAKRRMIHPAMTQPQMLPGGPYVTGIVPHQSDVANATWDGTQPPNTQLPGIGSLASTSQNSSLPVLDQQSASWDPSRQSLSAPNQPLDKDLVSVYFIFRLFVGICY